MHFHSSCLIQSMIDSFFGGLFYGEDIRSTKIILETVLTSKTFRLMIDDKEFIIQDVQFEDLWKNVFDSGSRLALTKLINSHNLAEMDNAITLVLYHCVKQKCEYVDDIGCKALKIDGKIVSYEIA
jgi:hypothetical protein